jgi:hypothetical protein
MRTRKLAGIPTYLAAVGLAFGLALPADAGTDFDGMYNVDVMTDVGGCDKLYHGVVTIQGGHVVSTGDVGATAFGLVDSEGTVSMQFRLHDDIAHVAGHVKGRKGQGTWSAPTPQCGGRWRAERQS